MSETTFSSSAAFESFSRLITIQGICDTLRLDGQRRYQTNFPTQFPVNGHVCAGAPDSALVDSYCGFAAKCFHLTDSAVESCANAVVPAVKATVTHIPILTDEASGSSCYYATAPYVLPQLQGTLQSVEYRVSVSYAEDDCVTDPVSCHSVTVQCQQGGDLSLLDNAALADTRHEYNGLYHAHGQ